MRKRERENVVGKIAGVSDEKHGGPICIRAYETDDKRLDELAKETGEGKAAIVRRMIRFALSDKRQSFASNRCQGKLDWLIKHDRKADDVLSQMGKQIDDILERIEGIESEVKVLTDNSRQLQTFIRELYCMTWILVSSQNLTLTRLLEFSSPSPKEREQAVLIAAAARANQIGEAVKDLTQFAAFHNIPLGDDTLDHLFLLTKVNAIKDLIAGSSRSKPHESAE
jgi:hypothetical protein